MPVTINGTTGIETPINLKSVKLSQDSTATFVGTGSVSGSTLTITAVTSGSISVGDMFYTTIDAADKLGNTNRPLIYVSAFGTGSGGTGTYTLSDSQGAISSRTIYCGPNYLNNSIIFEDTDTTVSGTNRPVGYIAWTSYDSTYGTGPRASIYGRYSTGATFGSVDLIFSCGSFIQNYGEPSFMLRGINGTVEFIKGIHEGIEVKGSVASSLSLDSTNGNYFSATITQTTTVSMTMNNASSSFYSFILDLTNGGSQTINWLTNTKWAGGSAPTLTASGRDVLGFYTTDGGTNWTGLLLGKDVK